MSMGSLAPIEPLNFLLIDGKLHLFLKDDKVDTKTMWEATTIAAALALLDTNPTGIANPKQRADEHWTNLTFK